MEDNKVAETNPAGITPEVEAPGIQLEVRAPEETKTIMTIGSSIQSAGHNTIEHSVSLAVAPKETPPSNDVRVLIKYPSNWKKDKFLKDGDKKLVSPETAKEFVRLGIATIIEQPESE